MRMLANQERCPQCKKTFQTWAELLALNDSQRMTHRRAMRVDTLPGRLRDVYDQARSDGEDYQILWYNGRPLHVKVPHPGHCSEKCLGKTNDERRRKEEARRNRGRKEDVLMWDKIAIGEDLWDEHEVYGKKFHERRVIPPKVLR